MVTRPLKRDQVVFGFATLEDVPALNELFQAFFAESSYPSWGILYSPARAAKWLEVAIHTGSCPHLMARHVFSDEPIGVLSYHVDHSFSVSPIAILNVLYVRPEHRKSAIGRSLLTMALDVAKTVDGCCVMTTPITSGLRDVAALRNLLLKADFKDAGVLLRRTL